MSMFWNLSLKPLHLYHLFKPKDVKPGTKPFVPSKFMKTMRLNLPLEPLRRQTLLAETA